MSLTDLLIRTIEKSLRQRIQAKKKTKQALKGLKVDKETKKLAYKSALSNIKKDEKQKSKENEKTSFPKKLVKTYRSSTKKKKKSYKRKKKQKKYKDIWI